MKSEHNHLDHINSQIMLLIKKQIFKVLCTDNEHSE